MEEKSWAYKLGYIFGTIFIGSIVVGCSALIVSTVVRLIMRMF